MNKILLKSFFKVTGLITLSIGKSIWRATVSVLHLVVYAFLLLALLNYYGINELRIEEFKLLLIVLVDLWKVFWWIFFISNMYDDWRYNKW